MEFDMHNDDTRILWHPAFYEAIQLELEQYRDVLRFDFEQPLNTEPLRIDVTIVLKAGDVVIEKNIAAMFKKANVVEYKGPGDYVSIADFYKVYGYACLYCVLNELDITDLTISFVESCYPRELLSHFEEMRGYTVEERSPGIYTVKGDILPIQIIDSKRLSAKENLWLKDLGDDLDAESVRQISAEVIRRGKTGQIKAYLEALFKANAEIIREVTQMSDGTVTLDQVLEEVGLTAIWEARGEARGKAEGEARGEKEGKLQVAHNLIRMGLALEKVAEATELDLETVKSLYPPK
jgi:hypothetical protein